MMKIQDEEELIQLAKQGDLNAQTILIKKYERLAYSAIPENFRGNRDAQANALYTIWEVISKGGYDPSQGSFPGYIYASARYNSFKWVNKQRKGGGKGRRNALVVSLDSTLTEELEEKSHPLLVENIDPVEAITSHEQTQELYSLIESSGLTPEQMEVVSLRLQDLSFSEIANHMKINYITAFNICNGAIQKIKKRVQLEESIVAGIIPYNHYRGKKRLFAQREVFQFLLEKTNIPIGRIPSKILIKYRLYPVRHTTNEGPPTKPEAINRLLLPDQKIPLWKFHKSHKWTGTNNRKLAFDAMEYMIMQGLYVVTGKRDKRFRFSSHMVDVVFGSSIKDTNTAFQKKRLGLEDIVQRQKLSLLADITDNNSNIFEGNYQTAQEKINDHLEKLESIVERASVSKPGLTERQKKVYNLWTKGLDWNEIMAALPVEFEKVKGKKREKGKKCMEDMILLKYRLRVAAIELYKDEFEKGADMKKLQRETLAMYQSGKNMPIYDRYFRLRLGILIKKIAENKKWPKDQLPYLSTIVTLKKLRFPLTIFNYSIYRMFEFALPGEYPDWQFVFKGKWSGDEGRQRSFQVIDYILTKKQGLMLDSRDFEKYHLDGMLQAQFKKSSLIEANKCYVDEYLSKKLGITGKELEEYKTNRKIIALLFGINNNILPINLSDKQILSLDRQQLYKDAKLTNSQQYYWEQQLSLWNYNSGYIKINEIANAAKRNKSTVRLGLDLAKKKFGKTLVNMYSK